MLDNEFEVQGFKSSLGRWILKKKRDSYRGFFYERNIDKSGIYSTYNDSVPELEGFSYNLLAIQRQHQNSILEVGQWVAIRDEQRSRKQD